MKNLTWEITGAETEGERSVISVRITNTDMSDVMGRYTVHVLEKMTDGKGTG